MSVVQPCDGLLAVRLLTCTVVPIARLRRPCTRLGDSVDRVSVLLDHLFRILDGGFERWVSRRGGLHLELPQILMVILLHRPDIHLVETGPAQLAELVILRLILCGELCWRRDARLLREGLHVRVELRVIGDHLLRIALDRVALALVERQLGKLYLLQATFRRLREERLVPGAELRIGLTRYCAWGQHHSGPEKSGAP